MQRFAHPRFAGRFVVTALALLGVLCLTPLGRSAGLDGDAVPELHVRLLGDVKFLASDELEGRGVGTAGLNLAADHVAKAFGDSGLDVAKVGGGPFQKFTMTTGSKLGEPNTLQFAGPDEQTIDLKPDSDFRTCSFGGSAAFKAGLVFAGYAIESDDPPYNDFSGMDVKDKVVIILRRVPQQWHRNAPFAGPHGGMSRHADLRTKVSNAFRAGAAAILLVNDPFTISKEADERLQKATERVSKDAEELVAVDTANSEKLLEAHGKLSGSLKGLQKLRETQGVEDSVMPFGFGGHGDGRTIPVLHITQEACNRLLKAALNKSLEQLEAGIDLDLKPHSAALTGWTATGAATVERVETEVKNVIAVLEGAGPLADETIVVGAHYDHLGLGGSGSLTPGSQDVHNGADDNASGTVSLLELARRLAARPEKLPRRIVFIAFTAEESGLIGSARYVKEPLVPLDKTIAMFNMDMVGRLRDDKLTVFGSGTAARWKDLLEGLAKDRHFQLTLKPEGFGPSDQSSFYAKQIPVLHFFTGTHSDYHRPGDDWDKINVEGMVRVVELVEDVVVRTAQSPDRPQYLEVKQESARDRSGNRPYFGSIPDFGTDAEGYAISGTAPESPAAKGGLKGGDLIIQFGAQKIGGLDDFDLALRKFAAGDEVDVTVLRDGKPVKLRITLGKPR